MITTRILIIASALFFVARPGFAQTVPPAKPAPPPEDSAFPIVTDRPSFADGSALVPLGHWQIETGTTFFRIGGQSSGQFPEMLIRYPVSERVELRLINVDYTVFEGGHGSGFQDPSLGFKLLLTRLNHRPTGEPAVTFIALTSVPVGGTFLRATSIQPTFKIASDLPLTALDDIGANLIVSYLTPNDAYFTQYAGTVYYNRQINSTLSGYLEVYGMTPLYRNGPAAGFSDIGLAYLLNKRTQVDIRYGQGFDMNRDGYYIGAGVSYRF